MLDEKLLNRMTRLCSLGEHCTGDILSKAEKLCPGSGKELVEYLAREGYLDDARYAGAFARDKSALQGWGIGKIRLSLLKKGIEPSVVEEALSSIDADAAEKRFQAVMAAKWRSLSSEQDPQKKKLKLLRYAVGRGFGYDEILKWYDNNRRN